MDSREEILHLFRQAEGHFVSGAQISRTLGVSRSAVWKQICALRDLGYEIEAVTSKGYRMVKTPDLLMPAAVQAGLNTEVIGRKILCLDEVDSTNVKACELGDQGEPEGTVVFAESQSGGKGRLGRRWESPPGVNLYASIVVRPAIPPWDAPQLTFVAAAATARVMEELYGLPARVKWPNDILIGGRKVAGLLNEMSGESERMRYVVLGIGVNLNMRAEQFPDDLRYPATSVSIELGRTVNRLEFARALLSQLDALYVLYLKEGFSPVLGVWLAHFDMIGRPVEVALADGVRRGTVIGLDSDGGLLLDVGGGEEFKVLAGDVRPLSQPDQNDV